MTYYLQPRGSDCAARRSSITMLRKLQLPPKKRSKKWQDKFGISSKRPHWSLNLPVVVTKILFSCCVSRRLSPADRYVKNVRTHNKMSAFQHPFGYSKYYKLRHSSYLWRTIFSRACCVSQSHGEVCDHWRKQDDSVLFIHLLRPICMSKSCFSTFLWHLLRPLLVNGNKIAVE